MLFLFLLWSILGCHIQLLQTACHSVPCCHLEVKHWSRASGDIREQNLQDPHLPVSATLTQKTLGCPKSVSSRTFSFSINKDGLDIVVPFEPCPYFTVVVVLLWFCFALLLFLWSRNSGSPGWPQKSNVAEGDLEYPILLILPPKFWGYLYMPPNTLPVLNDAFELDVVVHDCVSNTMAFKVRPH